MKPRTQPDLASTLESQGGQPPRRAAASFNQAVEGTGARGVAWPLI